MGIAGSILLPTHTSTHLAEIWLFLSLYLLPRCGELCSIVENSTVWVFTVLKLKHALNIDQQIQRILLKTTSSHTVQAAWTVVLLISWLDGLISSALPGDMNRLHKHKPVINQAWWRFHEEDDSCFCEDCNYLWGKGLRRCKSYSTEARSIHLLLLFP